MIIEMSLTRNQEYNVDETCLYYKALPTKTIADYSEKFAQEFKM